MLQGGDAKPLVRRARERSPEETRGRKAPGVAAGYAEFGWEAENEKLPGGELASLWYPEWDSNPHTLRYRFLRPTRLPFRHPGA